MKQPTTADVIRQLAKTSEDLPNLPLASVLLPPLVTHMAIDLGLTKEQAIEALISVWDAIAPVFPALREQIVQMSQSGQPVTTQELADAGDCVFLEHLPKKGAPS